MEVVSTSLKRKQLEEVVRLCGLSPAKLDIPKLRTVLQSLRRHQLPVDPKMVSDELVHTHKVSIAGV